MLFLGADARVNQEDEAEIVMKILQHYPTKTHGRESLAMFAFETQNQGDEGNAYKRYKRHN
jgi:hypothetical protein